MQSESKPKSCANFRRREPTRSADTLLRFVKATHNAMQAAKGGALGYDELRLTECSDVGQSSMRKSWGMNSLKIRDLGREHNEKAVSCFVEKARLVGVVSGEANGSGEAYDSIGLVRDQIGPAVEMNRKDD